MFVKAKPRLEKDVAALIQLTTGKHPPLKRRRSGQVAEVYYGFGDASGSGFGATFQIQDKITYRYGQWCTSESEMSSTSNWRELCNLVRTFKAVCRDHNMEGAEIFLFTDNTTAESTYWKGTSRSRLLSDLVLELKLISLKNDIILHVCHVSRKRMIAQGTDGLSRADHSSGVMTGLSMTDFVPLHFSVLDREPGFKTWFSNLLPDPKAKWLTPTEWFDVPEFGQGTYIWTPPPAAREVIVDQLGKTKLREPGSLHFIIVPRLMTGRWRRHLTRGTDAYEIINWTNVWNLQTHFEPLILFVSLPLKINSPNFAERLQWLEKYHGTLQSVSEVFAPRKGLACGNFSVRRSGFSPCRGIWCSNCFTPLGKLPFRVRKLIDDDGVELDDLLEENRCMEARLGDNLMVPFQCSLFHFRNIMRRDPRTVNRKDQTILEYCQRATLDSFWARASNTVQHNYRGVCRADLFSESLDLPCPFLLMGPFPLEDICGMQAAICILNHSFQPGRNEEFVQCETVRKGRSVLINAWQASAMGLSDSVGVYERIRAFISRVPTRSFWFSRFISGFHKRLGDCKRDDEPISIDIIHSIDRILEAVWNRCHKHTVKDEEQRFKIAELGAWFIVGFVLGLRGEEMPLIEFAGTAKEAENLNLPDPYFSVVISGRTKGVQLSGHKFRIHCVAETTGSKLKPGKWMRRLINCKLERQDVGGRLFQRGTGGSPLSDYTEDFFEVLERVQTLTEHLEDGADIRDSFGILRTLRKSHAAHAINMEIPDKWIERFNRWRKEYASPYAAPRLDMIETYATWKAIVPKTSPTWPFDNTPE